MDNIFSDMNSLLKNNLPIEYYIVCLMIFVIGRLLVRIISQNETIKEKFFLFNFKVNDSKEALWASNIPPIYFVWAAIAMFMAIVGAIAIQKLLCVIFKSYVEMSSVILISVTIGCYLLLIVGGIAVLSKLFLKKYVDKKKIEFAMIIMGIGFASIFLLLIIESNIINIMIPILILVPYFYMIFNLSTRTKYPSSVNIFFKSNKNDIMCEYRDFKKSGNYIYIRERVEKTIVKGICVYKSEDVDYYEYRYAAKKK